MGECSVLIPQLAAYSTFSSVSLQSLLYFLEPELFSISVLTSTRPGCIETGLKAKLAYWMWKTHAQNIGLTSAERNKCGTSLMESNDKKNTSTFFFLSKWTLPRHQRESIKFWQVFSFCTQTQSRRNLILNKPSGFPWRKFHRSLLA